MVRTPVGGAAAGTRGCRMTEHRNVFVLSGGAARGAVHVGMMQTLLEGGVVPHALVGTSVGAINAAFMGWRTGLDRVHELADHWLRIDTHDIFPGGTWTRLAHIAQRHSYLYSSEALRHLITTWMPVARLEELTTDRKSTRLNSSHPSTSYAVFCLKKKTQTHN